MKVVLFCGGLGTRLGETSDNVPKPMVKIGYRPILWHLMKYYAYYGHNDFILCYPQRYKDWKQYTVTELCPWGTLHHTGQCIVKRLRSR